MGEEKKKKSVSKCKINQTVSRECLVQHLFPLSQMKIALVCRKHSFIHSTLGQPVLSVFCFVFATKQQPEPPNADPITIVLLLHQPPSLQSDT